MTLVATILPYVQIVLAVLLIGGVLLQQTGSSLGGAFGGDNFASGFHTRRGAEKFLFRATIAIAVLFALSAFLALLLDARGGAQGTPQEAVEQTATTETATEEAGSALPPLIPEEHTSGSPFEMTQ